MTGRFPPNGGSSEYANIIGGIGNIRQLLDEEFAKKLQSGDLSAVSSAITSGAVTAVGIVSSGVLPGLGPTPVQQLINQLGSSADDIAQNAGNIVRGGIGGLVSAVKALLGIALKIIGVTFAILMARFFSETEIQRISAIINELLALRDRVTALEQELMGLREITEQGFLAVNNNVITVDSNLREVQSNLARGISMTAGSTTKLIKAESFGVKQAVNTVKTELGSQIEAFQSESRTEWLNNRDWQFNNRAAAVATLTVAGVTAPEGMLDKTFQNPTNIKQTVTNTAVKVQEGFQKNFDKFKSVGSMIDVGRIIDVITLNAVIHNAAMLSSSLSQTLFKVVYNGLNIALDALGVKDIEGEAVDFEKSFIGAFQ
jgi:hypothetical protein